MTRPHALGFTSRPSGKPIASKFNVQSRQKTAMCLAMSDGGGDGPNVPGDGNNGGGGDGFGRENVPGDGNLGGSGGDVCATIIHDDGKKE